MSTYNDLDPYTGYDAWAVTDTDLYGDDIAHDPDAGYHHHDTREEEAGER